MGGTKEDGDVFKYVGGECDKTTRRQIDRRRTKQNGRAR